MHGFGIKRDTFWDFRAQDDASNARHNIKRHAQWRTLRRDVAQRTWYPRIDPVQARQYPKLAVHVVTCLDMFCSEGRTPQNILSVATPQSIGQIGVPGRKLLDDKRWSKLRQMGLQAS
jgi:hypothetical protein